VQEIQTVIETAIRGRSAVALARVLSHRRFAKFVISEQRMRRNFLLFFPRVDFCNKVNETDIMNSNVGVRCGIVFPEIML
jgi:hypothetical protein